MRRTCLNTVYEMAKTDERIFFVGSDLGFETLDQFKNDIPDRFFMEGVSEAHVIGMSAGLALAGNIVYVNTIATFLTRRCFEQTALDLCLHNVPVRLIGNGGGLVYAPLGPTHLATDDLAIMRALPRMTILAPADAEEMNRIMPLTVDYPGPIYIRLAKGGDPIVTDPSKPLAIGMAVPMREGKDALIVSTGVMLQNALKAADRLARSGIHAAVLHLPTVKPLDSDTILYYASEAEAIVTIEEHTLQGGLGSAVAEVILEANFDTPKKFHRIGLPDCFPEKYGSQADLWEYYGLTQDRIVKTVEKLLDTRSSFARLPLSRLPGKKERASDRQISTAAITIG